MPKQTTRKEVVPLSGNLTPPVVGYMLVKMDGDGRPELLQNGNGISELVFPSVTELLEDMQREVDLDLREVFIAEIIIRQTISLTSSAY